MRWAGRSVVEQGCLRPPCESVLPATVVGESLVTRLNFKQREQKC